MDTALPYRRPCLFDICVCILIIQNSPLDAGDFTMDGEFLAESLGKDLRSNLTLGKDPNP